MRFQDKVCLVTGGTSGIGRATCLAFAREGAHVVVVGREEAEGRDTAKELETLSGRPALFVKCDIGYADQVKAAVQATIDRFGRLDVLVNNAAMMTYLPIGELPEADWDRLMNVNLKSVFLFCKYALPHLSGGAIVNISSVHAHETTSHVIPYATSKGGMEAFTRGLSREVAAAQVRVNCVAPGAVDTPMLWENPNVKSGREKIEGQVGKPEEVAAAILFLASVEANYINGTTLVVDGGRLNIL